MFNRIILALSTLAFAAGCSAASEVSPSSPTDLHGHALSIEVGSTTRDDNQITTRVSVNGEALTVVAAGQRVAVARADGSEELWIAPRDLRIRVGGTDSRTGEAYSGELDVVSTPLPAESIERRLVLAGADGTLVGSDLQRLDVALPVAIEVARGWSAQGLGGDAERTLVAYASALVLGPRLEAPPAGIKTKDIIRRFNECSVTGPGCSCSVSCGSNYQPVCTNYPTCSCSCKKSAQIAPVIQ